MVRTDEAVPKLGVWLEVLAMVHHGLAQVGNWEGLLPVIGIVALREGFDIGGGRLV